MCVGSTVGRAARAGVEARSWSATASGSSCSATSSCSPRFFAAYAVLSGQTAGGPSGAELFDLQQRRDRDGCLLLSSFTCGLASIARRRAQQIWFYVRDGGDLRCSALAFLFLEVREFAGSGRARRRPDAQRLPVGLLHAGRLPRPARHRRPALALTMMAQVFAKGFRADILRRVLCFSLFWHALDIIWVAMFTVVYLMGARHERHEHDMHARPRRSRARRRSGRTASARRG